MPVLDLSSLKNEAKNLKKKLGHRGMEMTLCQARDLIAHSAGAHDWNALYLENSTSGKTHGKREQTPFYREIFSSTIKRHSRLFAALLSTFPGLNTVDGRHTLGEITQCVLGPAFGIDDIRIKQDAAETCVITPSMMTSSRWKGGVGVIGQGATPYNLVMRSWVIPWLQEHGGLVFIRQSDAHTLLDWLHSKADLPVRVVDLTTPPSSMDDDKVTPSTLNVPGMARLATKTHYPDELKTFLLTGQVSNGMWDGKRQMFVNSLLPALDEYKRQVGDVGSITNYFQLEALYNLAYDVRLSRVSTSGLRHFLDSVHCVKNIDGNPVFMPQGSSEEQMFYITAASKWVVNITTITCDSATEQKIFMEDLLQERAITVFVAPDKSPTKRFDTDDMEYFTVMKNTVLGLFRRPDLKRRKDTPLLIGAHDIELLCDLSPIHDLITDIRHAGWGWFTQIPTDESLSGVNFDNEQLLKFVENTLQLPGPTIPIFSEFNDSAWPRWRDQRQAQSLSFALGKEGLPNPWVVTAKRYCSTSKD